MAERHPVTAVIDEGSMDSGDGHEVHWTLAGNTAGKPAVLLHGGPGSGSSPNHRKMFDPAKYLIVQFDQRNCGRSTPNASHPDVDLSTNTTAHLIADIEQLRTLLGIERWLVWGGSWGTTLGLAYAAAHPTAVTELLLSSVVMSTTAEVDWVTRAMGRIFPEQWSDFVDAIPADTRHGNLALAYNRLLMDPDPSVHGPAAQAWCDWEDVHVSIAGGFRPDPRFEDPGFRLAFARLVTHYWAHGAFLAEDRLVENARRLGDIPVLLCHGRRDISAPADVAFELHRACANSELFIAEHDGHGGASMTDWMIDTANRLAVGDSSTRTAE